MMCANETAGGILGGSAERARRILDIVMRVLDLKPSEVWTGKLQVSEVRACSGGGAVPPVCQSDGIPHCTEGTGPAHWALCDYDTAVLFHPHDSCAEPHEKY